MGGLVLRRVGVLITAATLAMAGCAGSSDGEPTGQTVETPSASPRTDVGVDLAIRGYRKGEALCYVLMTRSGSEVADQCPLSSATEDEAVFAANAKAGDVWYAVIWVSEGVTVLDASSPFFQTSDGWVVIESKEDGFFWLDLANLGATFHCSVEFLSLACDMTVAPPPSS
ncbi:MAG: hypothetical protein H6513_00785 [Acidimicrobiaceae bacterium]|nr:hypothetical protein [Acidimicrobiaceae bacterium]MCO5330503.1 hypothetical protein [Ilumatobacteraceae bacterium]